jgi:hypothetical protein
VCDGSTPLPQHAFAQLLGIAFAGFRKLDYLLRDDVVGNVAAINKPKRYPCHLIGKTHEPHGIRVESVAIEVGSDRHVHLPVAGGSATELSATDAWAKAASGGASTTRETPFGSEQSMRVADRQEKAGQCGRIFVYSARRDLHSYGHDGVTSGTEELPDGRT